MLIQKYWRFILSIIILCGSVLLFFVFGYDGFLDRSRYVELLLNHESAQDDFTRQGDAELLQPIDLGGQGLPDATKLLQDIDIQEVDLSLLETSVGNPSLEQLLPLYYKHKTPEVLSLLVEKALQQYDFEFALQVLSNESVTEAIDIVGIQTYIYLLFNEQVLDFPRIERIKEVLQILHNNKLLTFDELEFYLGLVTLSRGDTDNRYYFMDELQGSEQFAVWYKESIISRETYNQYKDVPEYYLNGLLGAIAYRQQYMRIAQKLGSDITIQGHDYVLAHQLVAYSSLLLHEYPQSQESLKRLMEFDQDHNQWYTYLLGISLFEQGDYTQSVFHFQAITDTELLPQSYQYLFLIYQNLGDHSRLAELMSRVIRTGSLGNTVYITFFEELFRNDTEVTQYYLDTMTNDVDQLMSMCYAQQSTREICMYGKAGLFYQLGEFRKAYQYLSEVVLTVYNSRIFDRLASIAMRMGEEDLAKKWYIWGMKVSSTQDDVSVMRNKLQAIMNTK